MRYRLQRISIHVPREGHDRRQYKQRDCGKGISIHVPREGHDKLTAALPTMAGLFLSTCPVRGTTA